jgi:hypothetical protein
MMAGRPHGFAAELLAALSGPLVWFFHFNVIYALAGFGSAFGFSPTGLLVFAWVATLAAVAALITMLRQAQSRRASRGQDTHQAIREIARALASLSLLAVLLEALALWIVPM